MNANHIRPSTVLAQKTPLNTDSTTKCCHREAKRIVSPTSVRWLWLQKRHLHSESRHNKQSFLTLSNIKLNLTTNFPSWKGCCRRLGLELPWQGNSAQDHPGPSKAKWKLVKEYLRISELGEVCFGSQGIWCRNIKSLLGHGNMNDQWSLIDAAQNYANSAVGNCQKDNLDWSQAPFSPSGTWRARIGWDSSQHVHSKTWENSSWNATVISSLYSNLIPRSTARPRGDCPKPTWWTSVSPSQWREKLWQVLGAAAEVIPLFIQGGPKTANPISIAMNQTESNSSNIRKINQQTYKLTCKAFDFGF